MCRYPTHVFKTFIFKCIGNILLYLADNKEHPMRRSVEVIEEHCPERKLGQNFVLKEEYLMNQRLAESVAF